MLSRVIPSDWKAWVLRRETPASQLAYRMAMWIRYEVVERLVTRLRSPIDTVIAPEIRDDHFYRLLREYAAKAEVKHILEIGSSSGEGSTRALVEGLLENVSSPDLYCLEISKSRFDALRARYASVPRIHCYNYSTLTAREFPDARTVRDFFAREPQALGVHSIDQVLSWLRADVEYAKRNSDRVQGVEVIKRTHNVYFFDLVLIDGSEFSGSAELEKVIGARYIFLDDVKTSKCFDARLRLQSDPRYRLAHEDLEVRNGFSLFERIS